MNYEYDELASLHTIEVLPQSVFDGDEFVMWECDFFKKAFEIIPGEDISFISEDAYVGLEHINWSVQGDDLDWMKRFKLILLRIIYQFLPLISQSKIQFRLVHLRSLIHFKLNHLNITI